MTPISPQKEVQDPQVACQHQPGEFWADGCCKERNEKKTAQHNEDAMYESDQLLIDLKRKN